MNGIPMIGIRVEVLSTVAGFAVSILPGLARYPNRKQQKGAPQKSRGARKHLKPARPRTPHPLDSGACSATALTFIMVS